MILKQRFDQRQVQKLILAPALQQAIKLLPLTNLELQEVIDEEVSENPLLELEEEAPERAPEAEAEASGTDAAPEGETPAAAPDADAGPSDEKENGEEAEFESYFQEYFDDGFRTPSREVKEVPSLENTLPLRPLALGPSGLAGEPDLLRPGRPGHRRPDHRERQRGRIPDQPAR